MFTKCFVLKIPNTNLYVGRIEALTKDLSHALVFKDSDDNIEKFLKNYLTALESYKVTALEKVILYINYPNQGVKKEKEDGK
jgi:hypothetical protein